MSIVMLMLLLAGLPEDSSSCHWAIQMSGTVALHCNSPQPKLATTIQLPSLQPFMWSCNQQCRLNWKHPFLVGSVSLTNSLANSVKIDGGITYMIYHGVHWSLFQSIGTVKISILMEHWFVKLGQKTKVWVVIIHLEKKLRHVPISFLSNHFAWIILALLLERLLFKLF